MLRALPALLFLAIPALAADGPLTGAIIVVDAGHGGQSHSKSYTGGSRGVDSKITESELNLRVSLVLEKLLKEAGAKVYMTRKADHRLSREGGPKEAELAARVEYFEHWNPHFFISVHHNAAESEKAKGHTVLYKHNADDDTLYKAMATIFNGALEGKVPGPKRALIKERYHILAETAIPGVICESGFMTNKEFDALSITPEFPPAEAKALADGAEQYWKKYRKDLEEHRTKLAAARAKNPPIPETYYANGLNPAHQALMKSAWAALEPTGKPDSKKAAEYVDAFKKALPADRQAKFKVKAEWDGKGIKISGTAEKEDWERIVDLLGFMSGRD